MHLKRMGVRFFALTAVLSVASGLAVASPAYATTGVTVAQAQSALNGVNSLVNDSTGVTSTSNTSSVAITNINGTQMTAPRNSVNPVQFNVGGTAIGLTLPEVVGMQNGALASAGVVVYPSGDSFANFVQADAIGGVRFGVVLANSDAPEDFSYNVTLPAGSTMARQSDGSLLIVTPSGMFKIAAPWAYDATGKMVWTQFFTDGESTIDLVVNHWGENVTYPIVADPRWVQGTWYGAYIIHWTRQETYNIAHWSTLGAVIGAKWTPIGAAFGLAAWWVQGIYDHGQCLVSFMWPGLPWATWAWSENC